MNGVPTAQMQLAMYRAHGISYDEYAENFSKQLDVEKKREREYAQEAKLLSDLRRANKL